jgi:hypothetical protein
VGFSVQQVFSKLAMTCMVLGALVACQSQQLTKKDFQMSEPSVPEAYVMAPLEYSWDTSYSALLMPPSSLRRKALTACQERGFDRAYMETIALDENKATAYFSCRGSDN